MDFKKCPTLYNLCVQCKIKRYKNAQERQKGQENHMKFLHIADVHLGLAPMRESRGVRADNRIYGILSGRFLPWRSGKRSILS